MSTGNERDNCRKFGPSHAPGWFILVQQPGENEPYSQFMAAMLGHVAEPKTFCTVKCLAEWAYVHAVADEAAKGAEPS